jgi:hypothetical protein
MNRTNRCLSFSSRRMAVWGAHASRVLVKAFCLHELPSYFYGLTSYGKRKVRFRKNAATSTLQACAPQNAVDASSLFIK